MISRAVFCWLRLVVFIGVISLFLSSFVSSQSCAPLPDDVIAWWTFDETNGTVAKDIIGDYLGVHVNNPVMTNGLVNGALEFRMLGDHVQVPNSSNLHLGNRLINLSILLLLSKD